MDKVLAGDGQAGADAYLPCLFCKQMEILAIILTLLLIAQSARVYAYRKMYHAAVIRINFLERAKLVEIEEMDWPSLIK